MNAAKQGDTVKVHYKAKANDIIIFDSTVIEPLQITIGKNEVIPPFENAIIGMIKGESKTIEVKSKEAFGPYLEDLVSKVDREKIPKDIQLQVGQQLQLKQADGSMILVTVKDLGENEVTLDANHPLAGKDIVFDIKLLEII